MIQILALPAISDGWMESSALRRNHHEDNLEATSSHFFKAEWPPHEEEFVITLDEDRWNLGSVHG